MLRAIKAVDPTFVLGVILTAAFYIAVFQPGMRESILYRYTTEHVVEYFIVALFMWGIGDVLWKLIGFPLEIVALRQDWFLPESEDEEANDAEVLLEEVRSRPGWMLESKVGQRLVRALEAATQVNATKDYGDQLKELKEQDEDSTHAKYTLIRFVASVTPILGFLGTVVHFGTALSGISFTEIGEKLPALVGEMGMAFNTTTVALAAATTMAFALFLCERIERGVDESVTRLVHRELSGRFANRSLQVAPFLSVLQAANAQALGAIQLTLQRQIETWTQTLDKLFLRFDARQEQELRSWHSVIDLMQHRFEQQDSQHAERFHQSLATVESRQDKHMAQVQSLLEPIVSWKQDFAEFSKSLDGIVRGEGKLADLQSTLNENLRLLHATRQMDEALHGLTAAIHLLTVRHPQTGRPNSAAA